MKVGIHVPQWGAGATRQGVLDVARAAEEAGLDSIWVSDHVVFPLDDSSDYPYRGTGKTPFSAEDGFLEALTVLAAVAGATDRIRLGTSVLVLPMRNPVLTAKVVATLDVLSAGRTILGLGLGWWAEEFQALGSDFGTRGGAFEEAVRILRMLWEDGEGAFFGGFHQFERLACLPRPVQEGGPPLIIGGMGPRSLERAGRIGDGWHAIGGRPAEIRAGIAAVQSAARKAARPLASLIFSTVIRMPSDAGEMHRLVELDQAGVDQVVMGIPSDDPSECCRRIEAFADAASAVRDAQLLWTG